MKHKCVNYGTCRGTTKHPGELCNGCKQAVEHLTGEDDRKRLRELEQKPRSLQDVYYPRAK
jgi:hypothetical protein